jgi:hypothetical protein
MSSEKGPASLLYSKRRVYFLHEIGSTSEHPNRILCRHAAVLSY